MPHKHVEDEDSGIVSVEEVAAHTHQGNGLPHVVEGHTHNPFSTGRAEGVTHTVKHIHAVEHDGKYAVYVGPVPNGAGLITLENTLTPILKKGAAPYEGKYLATKKQNLGDVRLTFEAAWERWSRAREL